MNVPFFVQVATDATLIRGIYDQCDQWCMYCPATQWCLAYRCGTDLRNPDVYRNLADRMREGMVFLKRLCEAEGRSTLEIDAILSADPRKQEMLVIDDPLEKMGRRYGRSSDAYLLSRPDFPFEMKHRASGPTPFEVFAWYHQLIPGKIHRALISARRAARGDVIHHDDALICAKVALIGMDRSLEALAAMAWEDDDARLESMQAQLRRLRREAEARFPSARAYVRSGLDAA